MNKEYIGKFCREFEYPCEAVRALNDAAEFVENEQTLGKMFGDFISDYNSNTVTDITEHYWEMTAYAKKLTEIPYETIDLLFYLLLAEHLEDKYEKAGLSYEMWHCAMNDLRCKLFECRNCKGVWGTFVGGWFPEFYSLKRFAFGRIQYQPSHISKDIITLDKKYELKSGELFLDMHIPSSGKLDIDDVKQSIAQATQYFAPMFEDKNYILFGCESWLLFDKHREWLPENSGIVRFMDLFSPAIVEEVNPSNDLWRIFNTFETGSDNRHNLPEDTLLQRKYKDFLIKGGKQGSAFGVFKIKK